MSLQNMEIELCPWAVQGWCARYNVSHVGGFSDGSRWKRPAVIAPGAFSQALDDGMILLVEGHDERVVFADSFCMNGELSLMEKPEGLAFRAWLPKGDIANRVRRDVQTGRLLGASWGGPTIVQRFDAKRGFDVFERIQLREVSLVSEGYCPDTRIEIVTAAQFRDGSPSIRFRF